MIEFEKYKAYYLSLEAIRDEECEMLKLSVERREPPKTTFIDAFTFLTAPERTLIEVPAAISDIKCSDGEYRIKSRKLYVDELLRLALSLYKEKISILSCAWYFIEKDECMDSPMTSNRFFLVNEGKIIRDGFGLMDCMDLKSDLLVSHAVGEKTWRDEDKNRSARDHRAYENFYESTEAGKFQRTKERLAKDAEESEFPEEPKLAPDTLAVVHAIEANTSWLKALSALLIGAILTKLFWH